MFQGHEVSCSFLLSGKLRCVVIIGVMSTMFLVSVFRNVTQQIKWFLELLAYPFSDCLVFPLEP